MRETPREPGWEGPLGAPRWPPGLWVGPDTGTTGTWVEAPQRLAPPVFSFQR